MLAFTKYPSISHVKQHNLLKSYLSFSSNVRANGSKML